MTDTNTGKNLGKGFRVVSQAYEEIDALISALSQFFDEKSSSGKCGKKAWSNWKSNRFNDNFIASWVIGEGEKKYHLGFQISLLGIGMEIEGNDEPLLHVFKWYMGENDNVPDLDNIYMYYPLPLDEEPKLWGDSLIVWPGEEDDEYPWTFSLRLAALTNKDALENYIIKPIEELNKKLTQEAYEKDSLNYWKDWKGLVRYNTLSSIQAEAK